jgi:hypothetical protein
MKIANPHRPPEAVKKFRDWSGKDISKVLQMQSFDRVKLTEVRKWPACFKVFHRQQLT